MMDVFRYLGSSLFGFRWVALNDFDGEVNIRRVKWLNGRAYASRVGFKIHDVGLLDDGGHLSDGRYVDNWEVYEPFAKKS